MLQNTADKQMHW